jgi:hypothetical protein
MGKKAGSDLMRLLDARVEELAVAREFTAQVERASLKASYTSSLRTYPLVAEGRIQ